MILEVYLPNTCCDLSSWATFVKLLLCQCHITLDGKSTLVQIKATNYSLANYLSQYIDSDVCRHVVSLVHNESNNRVCETSEPMTENVTYMSSSPSDWAIDSAIDMTKRSPRVTLHASDPKSRSITNWRTIQPCQQKLDTEDTINAEFNQNAIYNKMTHTNFQCHRSAYGYFDRNTFRLLLCRVVKL